MSLTEGRDYLAPDGLTSLLATFIFPSPVAELTNKRYLSRPNERFLIEATVTLTVGSTAPLSVPLTPVPVLVPRIELPTVLVLFPNENFLPYRNSLVVVVPKDSPLRTAAALIHILRTVESKISGLQSFAAFACLLLGLRAVASAVSTRERVRFIPADEIPNLNNIVLVGGGGSPIDAFDDVEAEDMTSSMMFLADPWKQAQCFNRQRFKTDGPKGGHFNLVAGTGMFIALPSLRRTPLSVLPNPLPPPLPLMYEAGCVVIKEDDDPGFDNRLSSLRFVRMPLKLPGRAEQSPGKGKKTRPRSKPARSRARGAPVRTRRS